MSVQWNLAVCYALYYCSKFFQFDVLNVCRVGLNEHPDAHIANMLTSIRGDSSGKHLKASQTSLLHVTKLMSSEDVHMGEVCSPSVCRTRLSGFIYIITLWCLLYQYKALRLLSSRMCMWKLTLTQTLMSLSAVTSWRFQIYLTYIINTLCFDFFF